MSYGYYADADNECRVFHVCNPVRRGDRVVAEKYSFICGNLTVFDQLSQTCTFPDNAVPCGNAAEFFYLNERIGVEDAFFHRDEDIGRAAKLVPLYGRYADSQTQNGRPAGKALSGFKGKAFFTNRDRKPAQSIRREDLNVTQVNNNERTIINRLNVPLDGAILTARKTSGAERSRGKTLVAGRRRFSTPPFGTLPGYGNRLNLDVINFRDNDFKVKRLKLMSPGLGRLRKLRQQGKRVAQSPQTRDAAEKKFVTNLERQAAESLGEPEIDSGYPSRTTSAPPGNQLASVSNDSEKNHDKPTPSTSKGADKVPKPSTTTTTTNSSGGSGNSSRTPTTTTKTMTQEANIEAKAVDDTKNQPGLVTEKPDMKEMPNSGAAIIKSSNRKSESDLKGTYRVIPAEAPAPVKASTASKSSVPKQSSPKSANDVKKASKKKETTVSHQGGKIKKRVSSKVAASETAGKPKPQSKASLKPKASGTAAAPQTTRKQTKIRSTAAPAVSTVASAQEPSTPKPASSESTTTPAAISSTEAQAPRSSESVTEPGTSTTASLSDKKTSRIPKSDATTPQAATATTMTSPVTTAKPSSRGKIRETSNTDSSDSTETPKYHSTNSPIIMVTIPPLMAVTSSTTTDRESGST